MNLVQSKNALATIRSRTRLFETLAVECESLGFEYDMGRSMSKNAAAARVGLKFKAAELINFAEQVEQGL